MAMTRVEQVLIDAFGGRTSSAKIDLMSAAEEKESAPLLREAYRSLSAKGVLETDGFNVVSLNRMRAEQVLQAPQLYEPLLGE